MKTVKAIPMKAPVSTRALIQRINRKLATEQQQLKATRGERYRNDLGDYYIIDANRNFVIAQHVDVEKLGREMECLSSWEKLGE